MEDKQKSLLWTFEYINGALERVKSELVDSDEEMTHGEELVIMDETCFSNAVQA